MLSQDANYNLCQSITGVVAPITPIVPGSTLLLTPLWPSSEVILSAYKHYDYPWYNLYDEQLPELAATGRFHNLRSVRQLDKSASDASGSSSPSSDLPDPANPPYCSSHSVNKANCVLRPCGHYGCVACLGQVVVGGNKCPVCDQPVSRMIGFQKAIPRVNVGAGSEGEWWSVEEKIEGVRVGDNSGITTVITLVLGEDNVSHLGGCTTL
jgi:hypothetical protein